MLHESLNTLPIALKHQYVILRIYAFIWWGFYSLIIIFQPLFLVKNGFPIWSIFINGALDATLSFLIQNIWSHKSEQENKIVRYMLLGNIFLALASILIFYVNSIWTLFLLTSLLRLGPNSDVFATALSYRISEHCKMDSSDPIERKFHNINIFAQYRKYGSIGWAMIAPIGGLILDWSGKFYNFTIAAVGFILLSLWANFVFKEKIILNPSISGNIALSQNQKTSFSKKSEQSIFKSMKKVFSNRIFAAFMIATFFFSAASTMTYQTQGVFYGLFAENHYYLLVSLAFSIAAYIEWPTMTIIARHVKHIGWERMVAISYFLTACRLFFTPFMLLFNGNIWWAYLFQVTAGIIFGLRLPSTTFGIYVSLDADKRILGQSINVTLSVMGSFFGSIIGAIVAYLIQDDVSYTFIYIYWIAAILAFYSAISFYYQVLRMEREKKENSM